VSILRSAALHIYGLGQNCNELWFLYTLLHPIIVEFIFLEFFFTKLNASKPDAKFTFRFALLGLTIE